jgi:hypothetical protein
MTAGDLSGRGVVGGHRPPLQFLVKPAFGDFVLNWSILGGARRFRDESEKRTHELAECGDGCADFGLDLTILF